MSNSYHDEISLYNEQGLRDAFAKGYELALEHCEAAKAAQRPDDISHLLHIPSPFTGSFEPFALAMEECAKQSAANDGKGFTSLNTIVMAALLQYRKEVLEKLTNAPVRESVVPANKLIERFQDYLRNIALGEEDRIKGCSAYNWGNHYKNVLFMLLGLLDKTTNNQIEGEKS